MKIIVTLSAYNGSQYIAAQLDSILSQTTPPHLIIIRDDGSSDSTKVVLAHYAMQYPCIRLVKDNLGNVGIQRSGSILLKAVLAENPDYILYADQDDVWLPTKIEKLLAAILVISHDNMPALVFSDAAVVDENLALLHPSLRDLQKLDMPQTHLLKALLLYCPALGCTMMFNRALLALMVDIPYANIIPDKWTLFFAAILGRVAFLPEVTILHRQHSNNVTGALHGIKRKTLTLKNVRFLRERYQTALDQACILRTSVPGLPEREKLIIDQFIALFVGRYPERMLHYCRFCLAPPHWKRKLGLFMSLLFRYSKPSTIGI